MLKRVPYHALNYSVPFIDMRHYGSLHQEGKFWDGAIWVHFAVRPKDNRRKTMILQI